jgi:hypothetical protein
LVWCPTCGDVTHRGGVAKTFGWPFCNCRQGKLKQSDPEYPGTRLVWVPPDDGDGVLRCWLEKPVRGKRHAGDC